MQVNSFRLYQILAYGDKPPLKVAWSESRNPYLCTSKMCLDRNRQHTWLVISIDISKMRDFWRSQAGTL